MAPNEASLAKFWLMIFQQKVPLIVMLCPFNSTTVRDDGTIKEVEESLNYWVPLESVGDNTTIKGDGFQFILTLLEIRSLNSSIKCRKFKLELCTTKQCEMSPCFDSAKDSTPDFERAVEAA